jgi:hypothetical protein
MSSRSGSTPVRATLKRLQLTSERRHSLRISKSAAVAVTACTS